jgi:hypothetical protein
MRAGIIEQAALFGLALEETRRHFDRLLGVLNKDNLQNQFQNPYANLMSYLTV